MSFTPEQVAIIKATVPILETGGATLTKHFYSKMLEESEEVRPFFNKSHQNSDAQPRALARALLLYAKNIDDLGQLKELVERIVHKHCALLVMPEHYPIIGKYLINAMKEVLGTDVATPAVIDAWTTAYNGLADILIGAEKATYDDSAAAPGGWRGLRQFRVTDKVQETPDVMSFYLAPVDGKPIIKPLAGQFLGFRFPLESGDIYNRQYSISQIIEGDQPMYRVSIKKVPGGTVSKHWHDEVKVGDVIDVTPPHGDMVLVESDKQAPLVLVGAGIGVTPLLAMIEEAAKEGRETLFVQCDRDAEHQPFQKFLDATVAKYPPVKYQGFFSESEGKTMPANSQAKRLTKADLEQIVAKYNTPTDLYLCGPASFMTDVRKYLDEINNKNVRVHYEFFGPTVE
ncbi:flavohemoprotein [Trichomonascus vanleenenianus]|uniref:flavohemoglobin n=1 Tax=Trichomonascus vanleenenianus TaxID=2268995 RepID=UPI003EC9D4D5